MRTFSSWFVRSTPRW